MNKIWTVLLLGSAVSATGCMPHAVKTEAPAGPTQATLTAQLIAESGAKIQRQLAEISAAEQGTKPIPAGATSAPGDAIRMSYTGDAASAVKRLAALRGYAFQVTGLHTGLPIPVTIDVVDVPFIRVLEIIGVQCSGRADVVVKDSAKMIELRYKGV